MKNEVGNLNLPKAAAEATLIKIKVGSSNSKLN